MRTHTEKLAASGLGSMALLLLICFFSVLENPSSFSNHILLQDLVLSFISLSLLYPFNNAESSLI